MKSSFNGKLKNIRSLVILLFSVLGISQEINFGAKAGLNISGLAGDEVSEFELKQFFPKEEYERLINSKKTENQTTPAGRKL